MEFSNIWVPIIIALIPALATLIGTLAGVHVQLKQQDNRRKQDDEERQQRQENVLRCLLRTELLNMYFKHIYRDERRLSQWEAENMHSMYNAYRELGGNSFVKDLVDRMNSWEVV